MDAGSHEEFRPRMSEVDFRGDGAREGDEVWYLQEDRKSWVESDDVMC